MILYLSQIRLSRSPSTQSLANILLPSEAGLRRSAHHNLLWSVFADSPDRRRDFLWREDQSGRFLTLSARPPLQTDLFEPHQVKIFNPILARGEKLMFQIRCNATRLKQEGQRVDVVMDALRSIPSEHRAEHRMRLASDEGKAWLSRQGVKAGFEVIGAEAQDYSVEALPRNSGLRKGQPQFGIIDLSGQIEITEPDIFIQRLANGFGRAKAFGCGLMLIRRTN